MPASRTDGAASPKVELRGLSMRYFSLEGETDALRDINFSVAAGEFVAIIGQSGCGKSTLLSLISGILKPTSGAVLVDGKAVRGPTRKVGYMLQQDYLFEWRTIMENAVLRGTPRHRLVVGDHVLAGPNSYLTGCQVDDEVFIATGAMVFNGARMGRASSVALGGAVHIGCVVPPETRIPIGWIAVGDPARLYPPGDAGPIRAGLEEAGGFLPFVFGTDPAAGRGEQMRTAMRRYTAMLAREHQDDE